MKEKYTWHKDDDEDLISRTDVKKEAEELQELGLKMMALKSGHWQKFELSDRLMAALEESKRITANEAIRRHGQFIGKLMRDQNIDAIRHQLDLLTPGSITFERRAAELESYRNKLMDTDNKAIITEFVSKYQNVDVQLLRQLIRASQKEQAKLLANPDQKLKAVAKKKLFQWLKETLENDDMSKFKTDEDYE